MIVYLLRHGIAEDRALTGGDAARCLTSDGVARLERATRGWQRVVGPVDRVLTSPLARARQTAAIFQRSIAPQAAMDVEALLEPSARALHLLENLQGWAAQNTAGIACVGHEPHLGSLLGLLLTGSERTCIPFKKGMLVAVEIDSCASMLGRLIAALSQRIAGAD